MEITLVQYLIVCPLVFLAGLMDSIAGGGGLISLPAFMIAGIPAHLSLGSNKMCSVMGTVVSTARFAKNGFINFKTSVWFAAAALIGSSIGSHLILMVSEGIIEKLMLVILPVVAVYVLWNKNLGDDSKAGTISAGRKFAVSLAAAFIVGTYDGFYGPGTGTFLILILTGAARYTMKEAAGVKCGGLCHLPVKRQGSDSPGLYLRTVLHSGTLHRIRPCADKRKEDCTPGGAHCAGHSVCQGADGIAGSGEDTAFK